MKYESFLYVYAYDNRPTTDNTLTDNIEYTDLNQPAVLYGPGDYEDGEVGGMNGFGMGNRSTRRKPAPTPLCPPQIPLARPGREPGPPRWEASD
jgi:hypothetical protein